MSKISKILVDQQFSEIGVNITYARLRITNPHQEMQITQEDAQMTVDRQSPQFKINRKKIDSESGLLHAQDFSRRVAGMGKNAALNATAKIASEGDYLAKTEQRGNRVAQIARQNSRKASQKEANIGLMPKSTPEIEWDPGYVRINWSGHNIKIEWEGEYTPELMVDPPHSVEVFLRTQPYFRITVEEGESWYEAGQHVDEKL